MKWEVVVHATREVYFVTEVEADTDVEAEAKGIEASKSGDSWGWQPEGNATDHWATVEPLEDEEQQP